MELIVPAAVAGTGAAVAGTAATAATAGTVALGTAAPAWIGLASGTAATAAAGSSFSAATALQILSGAVSVFGALSGIAAANTEADGIDNQAATKDIEAKREEVNSVRRTAAMKRELARVTGDNDVAFAAAGIDISQGVAADSRRNEAVSAANEISIDRADSDARKAMLRSQALGLRSRAKSKRKAGKINAIGKIVKTGLSLAVPA